MIPNCSLWRSLARTVAVCLLAAVVFAAPPSEPAPAEKLEAPAAAEKPAAEVPKILVAGKVVLLGEALKKRGIKSTAEQAEQAVLETKDGQLMPLVSDWRGRAFFQDERLRNVPVELVVRKHPDHPYLQVLMVFTFDEDGARQYTDYWCDICSIPMYEIKDCDCCRGPIRLRYQPQDLPDYIRNPPSK